MSLRLKFTLGLWTGLVAGCAEMNPRTDTPVAVDFEGNAYVTVRHADAHLSRKGLFFSAGDSASLFFRHTRPGKLNVAVVCDSASKGVLTVMIGDREMSVSMDRDTVPVGVFRLRDTGYVEVRLGTDGYAALKTLLVGGEAAEGELAYVKDFSSYWGRRGPSVHLGYALPEGRTVQWFYNEVTVPEGEDVLHSYYMANGFGEGYFGMQVNSPTERRILFSVWSPFDTQDPKQIPEDQKVRLLRKGEDVYVGEFGNEGSGGQSFLRYDWKAGKTYRFLNEVRPDGAGNTVYTAYFYATDEGRWRLIASFLRPKTDTYYTHAHSFLENFSPEGGHKSRMVRFGNAWARTTDGNWYRIANAVFTHDATAAAGVRKDYAGGVTDEGDFFLKNCGFFDEFTPYGTRFESTAAGTQPEIDFEALQAL